MKTGSSVKLLIFVTPVEFSNLFGHYPSSTGTFIGKMRATVRKQFYAAGLHKRNFYCFESNRWLLVVSQVIGLEMLPVDMKTFCHAFTASKGKTSVLV